MTYYLERWNYEKRKWEVLGKSKNKIDIKDYEENPKLKTQGNFVITKSFFKIFKKVLNYYRYYYGKFEISKFKKDKGIDYRNAANQHYHFIWFWVLCNKIPKIILKIITISFFPSIIALIIYLSLKNLSLTISIWAALVSMFTIILTNKK